MEILGKNYDGELPKVVIHCFTGSQDNIKAYIARGYYIGVTGYVCKGKHLLFFPDDTELSLRRQGVSGSKMFGLFERSP